MPLNNTRSDTPVDFAPKFRGGQPFHDSGRPWMASQPTHPYIRVAPEYVALRATRRRVGATRRRMLGRAPERLFEPRFNPLARADLNTAITQGSKAVDQGGFVAGGPHHLRTRPGYSFKPGQAAGAVSAKPAADRMPADRASAAAAVELPASPKFATQRFVERLTKLPYMNRLTRIGAGRAAIGKVLPSSPVAGTVAHSGLVRRV